MGRKFSTPAFCLTLFLLFSSRLAPAADKPHFAGGDRYIPLHEYIGSPFHMPWLVAAIAALLAASLIWSWLLRREVRIKTSKLRESEEMFRVLAETSTTGIFLYQGEKIIYVNPAMVSILGYSEEEFLGMKFWDWVHEDFREEVKRRGLAREAAWRKCLSPVRMQTYQQKRRNEMDIHFRGADRVQGDAGRTGHGFRHHGPEKGRRVIAHA